MNAVAYASLSHTNLPDWLDMPCLHPVIPLNQPLSEAEVLGPARLAIDALAKMTHAKRQPPIIMVDLERSGLMPDATHGTPRSSVVKAAAAYARTVIGWARKLTYGAIPIGAYAAEWSWFGPWCAELLADVEMCFLSSYLHSTADPKKWAADIPVRAARLAQMVSKKRVSITFCPDATADGLPLANVAECLPALYLPGYAMPTFWSGEKFVAGQIVGRLPWQWAAPWYADAKRRAEAV